MKIYNVGAIKNDFYQKNLTNTKQTQVNFRAINPNKPLQVFFKNVAGYQAINKIFGNYSIPVHNKNIMQYMRETYNPENFERLFNFAKSKGVFNFKLNEETGFVKTSFIKTKENVLMSDYVWVTDTCANMELLKEYKPDACKTIFNRLSEFYSAEQKSFDEIIENPRLYANNPYYDGSQQKGVAHVFNSKTGEVFKHMPKTRLESMGRYLQTGVELIKDGFNGKKYGYKNVDEIPDTVLESISNIVSYLKALNYPTARSCGNWEEQTFVNSLTSDTAIINKGLRDLLNLVYSDSKNTNIVEFKNRLFNTQRGEIFKNKEELQNLLKDGEARIREIPFVETSQKDFSEKLDSWLSERVLNRQYDAALSYVIQTEKFSNNIIEDVQYKLKYLDNITKALTKPNGIMRFENDEYLSLDYDQLENPMFVNKHSNEAEWFLVSEIASAYCSVAKELINYIKQTGANTQKNTQLLTKAIAGATEYINRSYARITTGNCVKSNGYRCPAYKVPEAYEAVTIGDAVKYIPGAHPLTWAASSLHKASKAYHELLNLSKSM